VLQMSASAYSGVSEYRRTLFLLRLGGEESCAVDVFRVAGGKRHEHSIHAEEAQREGDRGFGAPQLAFAPLQSEPDPDRANPTACVGPPPQWQADWLCADDLHLRLHLLTSVQQVVRFGGQGERSREMLGRVVTYLLAVREGVDGAPVVSTFCSVLEPYAGAPVLDSVERLPLAGNEAAVVLRHGQDAYTVLSFPDGRERVVGDIRCVARAAVVARRAGETRSLLLMDGTRLQAGGVGISLPAAATEGRVIACQGRGFSAEPPLPAQAVGSDVLVTLANGSTSGYVVASVAGARAQVKDFPMEQCRVRGSTCWPPGCGASCKSVPTPWSPAGRVRSGLICPPSRRSSTGAAMVTWRAS